MLTGPSGRSGILVSSAPKAAVSRCSELFDHLISAGEQRWWHFEAEYFASLEGL
jgi:hypothetical protein